MINPLLGLLILVPLLAQAAPGPQDPPPPPPVGDHDMVLIPAGEFIMGSDKVDKRGNSKEYGIIKPLYLDEHPRREVYLDAFLIDRFEVTNEKYKAFVIQKNYWVPAFWKQNGYLLKRSVLEFADDPTLKRLAANTFQLDMDTRRMGREQLLEAIEKRQRSLDKLPVTGITWHDAAGYCQWAGKRLPSEAEWEKAARGATGQEYPWGNRWEPGRANTGEGKQWPEGVAPVGSYEGGKSPYGLYDMAGNVMEWVEDWYGPYPGNPESSKDYGHIKKVARGGGWGGVGHYALSYFYRTAYRFRVRPDAAFNDLGFRCAKDPR